MLTLLGYFVAGFVQDIILTWCYRAISDRMVLLSGILAVISTLVGYTIFYHLVLSPNFFPQLLCYAVGGGLGTGLTVWYKNK